MNIGMWGCNRYWWGGKKYMQILLQVNGEKVPKVAVKILSKKSHQSRVKDYI